MRFHSQCTRQRQRRESQACLTLSTQVNSAALIRFFYSRRRSETNLAEYDHIAADLEVCEQTGMSVDSDEEVLFLMRTKATELRCLHHLHRLLLDSALAQMRRSAKQSDGWQFVIKSIDVHGGISSTVQS